MQIGILKETGKQVIKMSVQDEQIRSIKMIAVAHFLLITVQRKGILTVNLNPRPLPGARVSGDTNPL